MFAGISLFCEDCVFGGGTIGFVGSVLAVGGGSGAAVKSDRL
jgi:hypothetical protein